MPNVEARTKEFSSLDMRIEILFNVNKFHHFDPRGLYFIKFENLIVFLYVPARDKTMPLVFCAYFKKWLKGRMAICDWRLHIKEL